MVQIKLDLRPRGENLREFY